MFPIHCLGCAPADGYDLVVASKCGVAVFEDGAITNKADHIKSYIDGTIERLGFTPDLYYLHRIDPGTYLVHSSPVATADRSIQDTPLEESITALESLRKEGKTKYIGLSECSAATLKKANSSKCVSHYEDTTKTLRPLKHYAVAKIHAVQAEYSAFETLHEVDGLVDTARQLDVAYVSYGPLGHGWLVEEFPYNSPEEFKEGDYRRESKASSPLPIASCCSVLIFDVPIQFPSSKVRTSTPTKRLAKASRNLRSAKAALSHRSRWRGWPLRA